MKLQLDLKQEYPVLSVLGPITPRDFLVLGKGLEKVIKDRPTKPILMDLCGAGITQDDIPLILEIHFVAIKLMALLVVSGPVPEACHAPNAKSARRMIKLQNLLDAPQKAIVDRLVALYKQKKEALQRELDILSAKYKLDQLRNDNRSLKLQIPPLEKHLSVVLERGYSPLARFEKVEERSRKLEDKIMEFLRINKLMFGEGGPPA